MPGTLYLVGTPIGNLGDISPRALEVLRSVDFVAAEDTRVSLKLLNHFEIKKPLVCYFEHNKAGMGERLISRLMGGESCALVTDAGMPAISDPGEDIVRLCAENGVPVIAVPGPCALVTALAMSGLPTKRFCFEGFLPAASGERRERLEDLKDEKRTMIFYEAPHKLLRSLEDMLAVFGDRDIALCREMTKLHEEVLRTTVAGAVEHFRLVPPRGEFVLVLRGAAEKCGPGMTLEEACELVESYRLQGRSLKESAKLAAQDSGFSKNRLYSLTLKK